MTEGKVKQVARAICAASGDDPDRCTFGRGWGGGTEPGGFICDEYAWQRHISQARAAIAAMRDPTEAMVTAAEAEDDPGSSIYREPAVPCSHADAWRLMIDAALGEGDG